MNDYRHTLPPAKVLRRKSKGYGWQARQFRATRGGFLGRWVVIVYLLSGATLKRLYLQAQTHFRYFPLVTFSGSQWRGTGLHSAMFPVTVRPMKPGNAP